MKGRSFIGVVFSALLHAQSTPPAATPKFDVVSVKRCTPGSAATRRQEGSASDVGVTTC